MRIVTLATCHNRKSKTLNALSNLYAQKLPASMSVEHVIVDDGSIDGTSDAISLFFPDVEIITGDGNLYWAGGMRKGWEVSVKFKQFDYLILYNDDVTLVENAIEQLFLTSKLYLQREKNREHVCVGSFRSSTNGKLTYGGLVRNSCFNPIDLIRVEPLSDRYQIVDTLNMNCCLITKEVLNKIGFLSEKFIHGGADYEYGLKLTKAGGRVILSSGYLGYCERNPNDMKASLQAKNLRSYLSARLSIKESPLHQQFWFFRKYGGIFWLYQFIRQYIGKRFFYLLLTGRW